MFSSIGLIVPALIALVVIILLAAGYTKAPPDMAYIISGVRKKPRILIGQAGVKIPFFERLDKLSLGAIQIDVKTKTAVPTAEYINVRVDSTVAVRVGRSPEMIALAAQNFLNINRETIGNKINDLLEGNVREIVGQMKLTEMVSDRKAFSEKVQANVVPDLARFGLELVSFNVQNFSDEGGVIDNLGIDNVEQIRKGAAIAKSNAQREIAVAEAENEKAANDARIEAETEIAKKNNELAIQKAELKKQSDIKKAEADAAYSIQQQEQRKTIETTTANANLAKMEKEIELKERQVAITERALEADIKKRAEADRYAAEQEADARLYEAQKQAEAELFERERKAEADKIEAEKKAEADLALAKAEAEAKKAMADALRAEGEAKAEALKAQGLAEAEAIRAKAEAEAKGLYEKAEAMKQYGEAAKMDMQMQALHTYFTQLPAIAEAIAKPMQNIDSITMYGEGNTAKLTGDITTTMKQITDGVKDATGFDPMALLAGVLGGHMANN